MTTAAQLGLDDSQFSHAKAMVGVVKAGDLPFRAAVILCETGIVEAGFRIYANVNVPDSMNLPHERVGSDHYSVGPLQQQVPSWGSADDCMDPAHAAGKFLHGAGTNPGLLNLPAYRFSYVGYPNATKWDQIPTGSAAQAVQVSAFPTRYQAQEKWATEIAKACWGGPFLRRHWPAFMAPGDYFGLITGPAHSHGGFYARERPSVKLIQIRLSHLGFKVQADGKFGKETRNAVTDWQQKYHNKSTSRFGEVWHDDWNHLFTF